MKWFSSSLLVAVAILLNYTTEWVNCGKEEEDSIEHINNRPIVGILSQETGDRRTQYLINTNVKWLEAAGARVLPILINQPNRYYQYLMDRINGVILPGGMSTLTYSGFAKAADLILDMAIAKNDRGIYFPVWGVCQGFQKLVTYFSGNKNTNWITMCRAKNVALNLDYTPGLDLYSQTRMFQYGHAIVPILAKYPVTPNFHRFCLTTEDFNHNSKLTSSFILISSNTHNGTQFVSTIEHRKYPFYGVQWHPEVPQFNWVGRDYSGQSIHAQRAILVAQYMANFFVNQTRKNHQHFRWEREEQELLIINFNSHLKNVPGWETYKLPL